MLVYVTKFFWWEAGYWNTMDIAHDRGLLLLLTHCIVPFVFVMLNLSLLQILLRQLDSTFVGDAWYGFHQSILLPACISSTTP